MAGENQTHRSGNKGKGKAHGLLARPPFCNGGTPEDPLNLNNVGADAEEMKKELEAEANEIQGHMPKNPKDPLGIEKSEKAAKKRQLREENETLNKKTKLSEESIASDQQAHTAAEETPAEEAARKKREYKEHMKQRLRYGNFTQYYGTRYTSGETDPRLAKMPKEWFFKKNILDIGCNAGYLTLSIAKNYEPRRILGIDIDDHLVGVARKNIRHYCDAQTEFVGKFPASFSNNLGPISQHSLTFSTKFPDNVWFRKENYVLEHDEFLDMIEPEYNVILALSITKWIHLNWGDAGMKRFFLRAFRHLLPGGMFILEPQAFESYKKRAKERTEAWAVYKSIEFRPEHFKDYLINEVGFERCEDLGEPETQKKGFARPLEVYYKSKEQSNK